MNEQYWQVSIFLIGKDTPLRLTLKEKDFEKLTGNFSRIVEGGESSARVVFWLDYYVDTAQRKLMIDSDAIQAIWAEELD